MTWFSRVPPSRPDEAAPLNLRIKRIAALRPAKAPWLGDAGDQTLRASVLLRVREQSKLVIERQTQAAGRV